MGRTTIRPRSGVKPRRPVIEKRIRRRWRALPEVTDEQLESLYGRGLEAREHPVFNDDGAAAEQPRES